MSVISKLSLLFVLCFTTVGYSQSEYAPIDHGMIDSRVAQLESELASLRAEVYGSVSQSSFESPCDSAIGCDDFCVAGGCNRKCKSGGLEFGAALFFAKPHMKESFQATVADVATGSFTMIPFEFDHEITPRTWLGYFNGDGEGVRVTHWLYDHAADDFNEAATLTTFPGVSSVSVIFPAAIQTSQPGDILSVTSGLEAQTLDLEVAKKTHLSGINLLISLGVRYANMEQYFNSTAVRGVAPIGILNWTRKYEGVGLTMGGEAQKSLGGSGLSFVGAARGSLLFGEKELRRATIGDVTPAGAAVPPFVLLDDADEVSGIFGIRAGMQWARETRFGLAFAQAAYETQLWTAAGAPTLTFLGFDGFSVAVGVSR